MKCLCGSELFRIAYDMGSHALRVHCAEDTCGMIIGQLEDTKEVLVSARLTQ